MLHLIYTFGKYVGMFLRLAYNKHLLSNNIEMIDANGKLYTEAEGRPGIWAGLNLISEWHLN